MYRNDENKEKEVGHGPFKKRLNVVKVGTHWKYLIMRNWLEESKIVQLNNTKKWKHFIDVNIKEKDPFLTYHQSIYG